MQSKSPPELVGPWFGEYRAFRHAHVSTLDQSISRDLSDVAGWLRFLRTRKRPLRAVRISDFDAYVLHLQPSLAPATVARILTSLRLFCRFLHSTGRLRYDLASSIPSAPRPPRQLPRALPWSDIQKLLRAVDQRTLTGLRDYTKRQVLQRFWKHAHLDPKQPRRWRPTASLLQFLQSL
jgi:site-specific recombinase XerD